MLVLWVLLRARNSSTGAVPAGQGGAVLGSHDAVTAGPQSCPDSEDLKPA